MSQPPPVPIPHSSPRSEDELATAIARQLPDYEIEELVGRGGTAHIFRARHRRDGHRVAIKLVSPDVARVLGVDRFLREIRIAASVYDPHLVPLAESGEVNGLPYYVMPLATGGSLRDRLDRERQLPLAEALRVARDVAEGLGHLHQAGIVHRDVKPENLLLGGADEPVRVADYGLARALTAAALLPLTSTGIVVGTPAYMSPEQGSGDPVDARADLYSWGCVLYEMLAGEAPFWGATAQALIGRHINDPPPALKTTRPSLPPGVEAMVLRAMAKSPADRFQSAQELVEAIDRIDLTASAATIPAQPAPGRRLRLGLAGIGLAAVFAFAIWIGRPNAVPLDSNRIVIFPFSTPQPDETGEGEQLALLIGSALERSEPLTWLDGWSMLDPEVRRDPRRLDVEQAGRLARRAGARYFLEGSVLRSADSLRVTARLRDLRERGNLQQHTAVGPVGAGLARVGYEAVIGILARLEGLRAPGDLALLRDRSPAAVAAWLQGERLYRTSRTSDALRRFEEAVAEDSLLAPAALRGAIAASWIGSGRAGDLVALAMRHADNLSPRQRALARAVAAYAGGRATQAMVALRETLGIDSLWADPWMLAGEVYLHLLPSEGLDSLALRVVPPPVVWPFERMAEAAFTRAVALDSLFLPPVVNLAEIALRQARLEDAARLTGTLRREGHESANLTRLELGLRCQRSTGVDWSAETRRDRANVFQVGALLMTSSDSTARACARSAFQSVLASDTGFAAEGWMALVGLHGMLAADDRSAEAVGLIDSAVAGGLSPALGLFVLDHVAGLDVGHRGANFIRQLGSDFAARGTPSLWLLTTWHASRGHGDTVQQLAGVLRARAAASGERLDRLVADVATAYGALARGDTAAAVRRFRALEPTAQRQDVQYSLWESLAVERLVLARLYLAAGQPALAHRVATTFDHPGVFLHPLFLRISLTTRESAARALGDEALADAARRRLTALARTAGAGFR